MDVQKDSINTPQGKGKGKGKGKVAPSSPSEKACWDNKNTEIFIRICVKEVQAGNRPHTHFSKRGWDNIIAGFKLESGRNYKRSQLKNRWDYMKKEWGYWKAMLKGETGLGWDNDKQTVDASAEWWDRKIQTHPECAKFRERGILLPEQQEILFNDVYATGENAWTPASNSLPAHMREDIRQGFDDCGDSIDALDDIGPSMSKKRQCHQNAKEQDAKKKSGAVALKESLDKIVECVATSTATVSSIRRGMPGTSIPECLEMLGGLPGVVEGDSFYLWACSFFMKPASREVFVALKNDDLRVNWLKKEFNG